LPFYGWGFSPVLGMLASVKRFAIGPPLADCRPKKGCFMRNRNTLWALAGFGALLNLLLAAWALTNTSGHTGMDPRWFLLGFAPLVAVGAYACTKAALRRAGCTVLLVGLLGVALLGWLDHANRLVQYERWLERGMP
jgi:O-antigen ligase